MKRITLAGLLVLLSTACFPQADSTASPVYPEDRYFRLNYDNDFFSATDRYYTQGIYLDLVMPLFRHSPVSKALIRLSRKAQNYYGLTLRQDGFTPRSIRYDSIVVGERPYASVFYLSHTLASVNPAKKLRLSSSFDLGLIGPDAGGEEEQKAIHRWLDNIQPLGWENQVSNDVVINYNVDVEKGILQKEYWDASLSAGIRAGTLYDDVSAGAQIRLGLLHPYFANLGITKKKEQRKFQCYVFAKGNIHAVAYNATLQGGMFSTSIYTLRDSDVSRIVATGYTGIVIAYKRLSLEYTKAYISPEFRKGIAHGWGHCAITVCF